MARESSTFRRRRLIARWVLLAVAIAFLFRLLHGFVFERFAWSSSARPVLIDGVRYKADIHVDGFGSDAAFLTDLTIRFYEFESDDETTARSSTNSRRYVAESISTPHRLTLRHADENETITADIDWTGGGLIDDRSITWSIDGTSLTVSELSQDYNLPNLTLGQTFDFPDFCREVLDAFVRLLWPAFLIIAFVLAITSKYLWIHTRRNSCNKCGYNLHGINSPRCPECGMTTHPEDRPDVD